MTSDQALTELRLRLLNGGYMPLPTKGKRPVCNNWQEGSTVSPEEVALWSANFPHARNTGMLTERTPAIDIDIRQADAATAVEELARERFDGRGTILVRFGEAPKRALLFRTSRPFGKMQVGFTAPGGSSHKIEVLGRGQQLVVAGVHPDTKRPYSWHGGYEPGTIPWSDLPEIDEREARVFLAQATDMLAKEYNFQQIKPNGSAAPAGEPTPTIDVASRLAAMRFGGAGDASVHDTQLTVTASLLRGGMSVEMAIAEVLEATRKAVAGDKRTEKWNWRREKRALSRMCRDFIVKNPELTYLLPDKPTSKAKAEKTEAGTNRPRPTVRLEDFYAYMPQHNYIFTPSCELWPASSINARIPPQTPSRRQKAKDSPGKYVVGPKSPRRADDMGARTATANRRAADP